MKKISAVILAVLICVVFSSCSTSIGIIGGADSETDIVVSQ